MWTLLALGAVNAFNPPALALTLLLAHTYKSQDYANLGANELSLLRMLVGSVGMMVHAVGCFVLLAGLYLFERLGPPDGRTWLVARVAVYSLAAVHTASAPMLLCVGLIPKDDEHGDVVVVPPPRRRYGPHGTLPDSNDVETRRAEPEVAYGTPLVAEERSVSTTPPTVRGYDPAQSALAATVLPSAHPTPTPNTDSTTTRLSSAPLHVGGSPHVPPLDYAQAMALQRWRIARSTDGRTYPEPVGTSRPPLMFEALELDGAAAVRAIRETNGIRSGIPPTPSARRWISYLPVEGSLPELRLEEGALRRILYPHEGQDAMRTTVAQRM